MSGSLDSSDVNSASLPTASSPLPTDDAEVESQKGLNQEEVVLEAPQGDLPDSRPKGDEAQRALSPALGRKPLRNLQRFRSPAGSPFVRRERLQHR